jgi:hypothetical protein
VIVQKNGSFVCVTSDKNAKLDEKYVEFVGYLKKFQ